jgi:hypothetical protein
MTLDLFANLGLQDTCCVPDPFGRPVKWYIKHISDPAYQEHIKKEGEAPLLVQINAKAHKSAFMALAVSGGDDEKAKSKREELLGEELAKIPADEWVLSGTDVEGIALLIDRWEGDDFAPFSYEAAVAGLSNTDALSMPISAGDDFSIEIGSPVGNSLAMWIIFLARQHDKFRADAVGAVEKN